MLAPPPHTPSRPALRLRAVAAVAVGVVALHWLALDGGRALAPSVAASRSVAVLQTRIVDAPRTPPLETSVADATPPVVIAVRPARPARHPAPRRSVPAVVPVALIEAAPAAEPPPAADAAPEALPPVPVYRTKLPPAMTLHYELQRGALSGQGTLSWRPQGRDYDLRLEGEVAGIRVLTQVSHGTIDKDGIAPDRFTDQRLRRGAQAANFQRDRKIVSYSGNAATLALAPGTQDRLSWMLQLAAVASAEPKRARPDGQVAMVVVGVRGEAAVWVFDFAGTEDVPTPQGTVHAVKFIREPRKPYDSKVEVWLDPARHHLPVHARFTEGESMDLMLIDAG